MRVLGEKSCVDRTRVEEVKTKKQFQVINLDTAERYV